jgi:hypothetical protein
MPGPFTLHDAKTRYYIRAGDRGLDGILDVLRAQNLFDQLSEADRWLPKSVSKVCKGGFPNINCTNHFMPRFSKTPCNLLSD